MVTIQIQDEQIGAPTFGRIDGDGSEFAVLGIRQYIELLVKANVLDEEFWPPDHKHGAKYLARIREIERECAKKHGKWDWELISPELQDEYDDTCALLDRMRYSDDSEDMDWEEFKKLHPQFQMKCTK
jgi:hypothetical protein